jgi:hypothetical protein
MSNSDTIPPRYGIAPNSYQLIIKIFPYLCKAKLPLIHTFPKNEPLFSAISIVFIAFYKL